ncbi:MAG: TonB-dependent receptor plug domain-containing protein [Bacteroidetes bacterium]|nr:TonB-dependent receptor plug domain-containing protein [Bacteroidota bacterium]
MIMCVKKTLLTVGVLCLTAASIWAQNIKGTVLDAKNYQPVIGATITAEGTSTGAWTDVNGNFELNVAYGTQLNISAIGYKKSEATAAAIVTVYLQQNTTDLAAVQIVASQTSSETPFTVSQIDKTEIQAELASRDIPLALNSTPSVFATNQGGGAGDARINLRGFNQRNISVMINGVPVNDMENGWVYWSNWDGLADAASTIQVQRGLSAVNLATPSVGGTMNIVTDPAKMSEGGMIRTEMGSWNFKKTTLNFNTGLMDNKLAFNGSLVRKTGDGFYQGTYTDAWAYYLGASYRVSSKDRVEVYALGAPQRHGQNLYKQNAARYSHEFAKSLDGYDEAALASYTEFGRNFNQNYNAVSPTYRGQQYWQMYRIRANEPRYNETYLMERENYFHKPQVNVNWYHEFSDKLTWSTIGYWSGGNGGGTGTIGRVNASYGPGNAGYYNWDTEIAENMANYDSTYSTSETASTGVIRNSVNQQNTYGAISKLYYKASDNLNLQVGVDWRTATIGHWREVRDLLGGDYYIDRNNDFDVVDNDDAATRANQMKRLGDKIAYHNTNTVNWFGTYAQADYTKNKLYASAVLGYTSVSFNYNDHFQKMSDGSEYSSDASATGFQAKGGLFYDLNKNLQVFANGGLMSNVPTLDGVMSDASGIVYQNAKNETISNVDVGVNFNIAKNKIAGKLNYYNTTWNDRIVTENYVDQDGNTQFFRMEGMNQNHSGVELEMGYRPSKLIQFDVAASMGNWVYLEDASGDVTTQSSAGTFDSTYTRTYYIKGLKVGDAPQTQTMIGVTVFPFKGLRASLDYRWYTNFYSDFLPGTRTALENDSRPQTWQIPDYGIVDFHATYAIPLKVQGVRVEAFAHILNLTDNLYIQEAFDNSQYNAFDKDHDADDAEVFLGLPRNYNAGITIRF